MRLLEVNNLYASYDGSSALRGINLALEHGEIVGLCGPNKAGKSTLCKCLAGSKSPDSGEVVLIGRKVTNVPAWRRLSLGLTLCPEGRGIYQGMTVKDNLRLGYDSRPARDQTHRLDQVLSYFPILSERFNQQAGTLSGGEAQMLGIAKKLLRMPRVLIVDEPSLGLSPSAIDAVFRALVEIRNEFDVSILLVEEAIARLAGWVDRAYVLHLGEVVAEGEIRELVDSDAVASAFAGELGAILLNEGVIKETAN